MATSPFVSNDISGFEDPKVTVARYREQEKRAAATDKAPTKAAGALYNKGANYEPLKLDENLWGLGFSSIRCNNIIG
ncbi:hypothetical protein HBH49_010950 [Parastagonospora nodorum]|nr:hypothetical protein HBH49_010950 [Parastagonospora nodorum]KAH5437869.1 hypothetical protein HBI32_032280 [Parastagonospora nodorum]KAH5684356.1 hypothetical protein HBI21_020240 [Parastagonospora nodorum]